MSEHAENLRRISTGHSQDPVYRNRSGDQIKAAADYLDNLEIENERLRAEVERLCTGLENIAVMNETDDCERLRNTARAVLGGSGQ